MSDSIPEGTASGSDATQQAPSSTGVGASQEASSSSSSSAAPTNRPGKRVQVVGAPPPGPPIPRDGAESDHDDNEDARSDAGSIDSDAPPSKPSAHPATAPPSSSDDDLEALVSDLTLEDEDLDLSHLSLKTRDLRQLNLPRFARHLKRLVLRQNLITKIGASDVGALEKLEDLDLYDNSLEKTYGDVLTAGCPNLKSLDLSFNALRHASNLSPLAKLTHLYLVQNKIARVRPGDFVAPLSHSLVSLELGGNRLRKIEGLEELTGLEELWLGKNKIERIEGLEGMKKLRVLSIQSNRITTLAGLEELGGSLEELYISHNGLRSLAGLAHLPKLRVLDIAGNLLTSLRSGHGSQVGAAASSSTNEHAASPSPPPLGPGLETPLVHLEEFWANDNQLAPGPATLRDLEALLGPSACPQLDTVYLEGNPFARAEGSAYRRKVQLALPQVKQIDATFVRAPVLR